MAEANERSDQSGGVHGTSPNTVQMHKNLARIARMFGEYRDDKLMRDLCRLAVKMAQERLIGG